ncbi:HAD family hydrolase [Cupriavidus basilensis]|uniref:HAD family hydrolase n=1 Tax=Cupriavidus basilensis TaxID=68895 RepID=UPI0039F6AC72
MQLVLFDLDHTLVPFDSGSTWLRYLMQLGVLDEAEFAPQNLRFAQDYIDGKLDIHAFQRFCMSFLARYDRRDLDTWRSAFIASIADRIPAPSRELVNQHRAAGDLCCIVTATNDFVARGFADSFGVAHLVASQAATVGAGPLAPFSGEMVGVPSFGAGKVERVAQWLAVIGRRWEEFERSLFYSDSANDLPLLEHVSHPIVVAPDPRLRAIALDRGWPVIEQAGPLVVA